MRLGIKSVRIVYGLSIIGMAMLYCVMTRSVFGTPLVVDTEAEAIACGIAGVMYAIGLNTVASGV